jgi:hypothetical protein
VLRQDLRERNWPALAALWTIGGVWLALVAIVFLEGVFDIQPGEAVGWTLLAFAALGFVLGLAGITAIRTRGETALAIMALVLAIALPTTGTYFLFGAFGGAGFD